MRAALASLALAATLTVHAHAQEVAGALQGRVVDSTGRALPEMQVTVSGPHLQGTRGTSTDRTGLFRVVALPPGEYTVVVRRIGWREVDVQHVEVQLGRTTVLRPVVADPHPTALAPVVVEAPALSLDPIHTDAGGRLTSEEYATLPGERDYKSMIIVLPHVNESVRGDPANVDGATGLENSYYIDGVNVTSELTAATGTSLPYNFVRAVEVKTGGYEAQYGKALGAVVNAVTYSGGNDFEVSGFAFGTSSALEATPNAQPVLSESGASSYDVGVRVSGPVARDRLWYSAAYNLRTSKVDRNVGDLGVYPDRLTANVFAGKLTWHAAPATQVELSLFGDPTTHDAVALPNAAFASLTPLAADPYRQRLESGGVEGVLRVSQRFGDRVQVEGSLARSAGRQNYLPETADGNTPLFWDHVTNTVSGGTLFRDQVDEGRWTGQLRATATWRRHAVVVGAEYEDLYVRTDHSRPGGYVVQHFPTYYTTLADGTSATNHNRVPTLYAQDAWQLADNLTLNAGMRWSAQTLIGASGNSAQQFGNEWQPRVGVIWQPGAGRRQRFFASYGRFYQEEPLNLASIWFVDFSNVQSYYSADPRQGGVSPDSVDNRGTTLEADWAGKQPGLQVENSDEFTVGYERLLGSSAAFTIRGIRRNLRSSFQWGADPTNPQLFVLGTPGQGDFAFLPPPSREYTALELSLTGNSRDVAYRASYVLSRNWGNYSGLYMSDYGIADPGGNFTFYGPWQDTNSTGWLPNDRRHVFKLALSHRERVGLTEGAVVTVASGMPLNAFAPAPASRFFARWAFAVPRGSAGRTPTTWDLNLRFAYAVPWKRVARSRVILDVLHVGNPQRAVWLQEQRYLKNVGGVFSGDNPAYGEPIAYQPPMQARLGIEMSF